MTLFFSKITQYELNNKEYFIYLYMSVNTNFHVHYMYLVTVFYHGPYHEHEIQQIFVLSIFMAFAQVS